MIGFTHSPYPGRILGALAALGAHRSVAVRGVEGSDVARPGRPTAITDAGPLELPEQLGHRMPPEGGAEASAAATRGVLAGDLNGPVEQAVALSAGLRLYAAGLCEDPSEATERGRDALRDGSAAAALDALLG